MPSILITRPAAMAEALAATLEDIGYEAVCEPLLSISPLHAPQPEAGAIDAIAITSSNALLALKERQSSIAELLNAPCFCVGARTAESARKFGFCNVQSADSDGAGLAKLINRELGQKNASILHVAGRDVSSGLRKELEKQEYRIIDWPVYEAIPVSALTPATRNLLMMRKLNAVVVFSPRTARVLQELIVKHALEACCASVSAICLSEAVADGLRSLKWRRLIAAPQPSEEAVIACLKKACPVNP